MSHSYNQTATTILEESRCLYLMPATHLTEMLARYEFLIHLASASTVTVELASGVPFLELGPYTHGLMGVESIVMPWLGGPDMALQSGLIDPEGAAPGVACVTYAGLHVIQAWLENLGEHVHLSKEEYELIVPGYLWVWLSDDSPLEVHSLLKELGAE